MRFAVRIAVLILSSLPLACTATDNDAYKLGKQYFSARQSTPPADPEKIEVTEVFWYGCPHCFRFDPYVERWLDRKPGDVVFTRLPSSLGRPQGLAHSKAFYTAESLGIFEQFHPVFFDTIQKTHASSADAIAAVFERLGISRPEFDGTFNGFAVDTRVRRAEAQIREFGITSVPSVVVDGRYWTNATVAGGGFDDLLKVVDFLVEKVRADRKSN